MSVSNKVALYAMLPAAGILLFGLAAVVFYPTTIEAKVSIVSSIATSVTVLFLISERLRDSTLRKLEFLNKRALSPALRESKGTVQSINADQSKTFARSSELLKRHGRFLRWRLYPKNLITTLDNATQTVAAYERLWQIILDMGNKAMGLSAFNIWALLKGLGFEVLGNYDEAHLAPMKEFFEELKKTDSELAKQFPIKGREVLQIKAEILKKLADFFADNQLEETRDPSMYPAIYPAGVPY
jgi:hypothetical protein